MSTQSLENSALNLRVAILGGGMCGLAIARILQINGIKVKVYELDTTDSFRPQGGSLDLHAGTGLLALRNAGLFKEFAEKARYDGSELRLYDKDGYLYFSIPGAPTPPLSETQIGEDRVDQRPEIDRTDLRKIWLDSLEPDTVQWGYKAIEIVTIDEAAGTHKIRFQNGEEVEADLVIGADGAWSKARKVVSDTLPKFTGVSQIELDIADFDNRFPSVANLVGNGMVWIISDGKAIIPQRQSYSKARTYVVLNTSENWLDENEIDWKNPSIAKQQLLDIYKGWNPALLECIKHADDESIIPRKIYALPIGFSWKTKPGITLMGDAAHVMSPFAGEGVNMALADANELSTALIELSKRPADEHRSQLTAVLHKFEQGMQKRMVDPSEKSARNLSVLFYPTVRKHMIRCIQHVAPGVLGWFLGNCFYLYGRLSKLFGKNIIKPITIPATVAGDIPVSVN